MIHTKLFSTTFCCCYLDCNTGFIPTQVPKSNEPCNECKTILSRRRTLFSQNFYTFIKDIIIVKPNGMVEINEGYNKIFSSIYNLHINWENDVSEERVHLYREHFLKLITYLWLHFVTSLLLMSLWLAEKCLRQTTCCLSSLIERSTLQIYHKDLMEISMSFQ